MVVTIHSTRSIRKSNFARPYTIFIFLYSQFQHLFTLRFCDFGSWRQWNYNFWGEIGNEKLRFATANEKERKEKSFSRTETFQSMLFINFLVCNLKQKCNFISKNTPPSYLIVFQKYAKMPGVWKSSKKSHFATFFKLKLTVKQCYQTGQFLYAKIGWNWKL